MPSSKIRCDGRNQGQIFKKTNSKPAEDKRAIAGRHTEKSAANTTVNRG